MHSSTRHMSPSSPLRRERTPAIPTPPPYVSETQVATYGYLPHIPYTMRVRFEASGSVDPTVNVSEVSSLQRPIVPHYPYPPSHIGHSSAAGESPSSGPETLNDREQISRLTSSPSFQPVEAYKMDCVDELSSNADRRPGSRDTSSMYIFHSSTTQEDDDAQSDIEVDEPPRSVCLRAASWCQPHWQYADADVVVSLDNNRTPTPPQSPCAPLPTHGGGQYQEPPYHSQSQSLDSPTTPTPGPSTPLQKHVSPEFRPSSSPSRSQSPHAPHEPATPTVDVPSQAKRRRRQAALHAEHRMRQQKQGSPRYPSVRNDDSAVAQPPHTLDEPPTPIGQGIVFSRPRRHPRQAALRAQNRIQQRGAASAPSVSRVATTRRSKRVDSSERNYCTLCDKYCTRIADLRRHELSEGHLKRVGEKGPGDSISILTSFICRKCKGTFSRQDALQRHERDYGQCDTLRRHRKLKATS